MEKEKLQIKAPVFNIQTYCIHDGPGIRTTVFVKGCPLRCLWCQNPESNLPKPELMTYASKCTGCGRCTQICPNHAIRIEEKEGKMIAMTDRSLCTNCGVCETVCPSDARELAGKLMSVGEALEKVEEDKIFYTGSGGGMTISGGEILMYPDFAEALYEASHEAGISTAIETCSFASRSVIDKVFPHVDIALLDLKHMNSAEHKRLTGVPNELILENIKHIYHDLKVPVTIRIPTIPECNDSKENIAASAEFVAKELGKDVKIHLLPYHNLGNSKNESLGKDVAFKREPPSNEHMEELKRLVESYGISAQIGGS